LLVVVVTFVYEEEYVGVCHTSLLLCLCALSRFAIYLLQVGGKDEFVFVVVITFSLSILSTYLR